ncbi:unnamed protein product [Callosobruchus maculatus]|uniref:Pseudouridine synthase I TruA alpha/beta domain-containing protein n=1 Tax=Callosobruchus maculatus TaxID=64391 RepID=A0A653BW32_CALMS|nr:unnamed protein product [Callosobruchus maculatus]
MDLTDSLVLEEKLHNCTKEELIAKVKELQAHNVQLRSIIQKPGKHVTIFRYSSRHILLRILYLGWDYKGFVVQEDTSDTIEHHLFEALLKTCLIKDRSTSNYHRCGRTDKGVSSYGQVISITVRSNLQPGNDNVDEEMNYCKVLNRVLPNNIQCVAWSPITNAFSARFDCKSRIYKYYFPRSRLNIELMREASKKMIGSHDFRNLCKMDVGNGVVQFVRNITDITIEPSNSSQIANGYTIYVVTIQANAFLWHQIRCIVGVLLLVGQGKEDPSVVDELLDITKNPRAESIQENWKFVVNGDSEYSMASEIPLNLFHSEYENIKWHYEKDTVRVVLEKLYNYWTFTAIKI